MSDNKSPVREERVRFAVDGDEVVGTLYSPEPAADANVAGSPPRPALVFAGPLTSVKEQVIGHYARAMAARGFIALAIDFRHFGESGGEPRQYEVPARKCEDARAALSFLAERDDVDAGRLGAVGVCAGAGYLAPLVAEDKRVKAYGGVAGFYHDVEQQKKWMGDKYDAAIARAVAAREAFEGGAAAESIPAVGDGDEEVAMPLREAFEYYGTERGATPGYVNAFAVMSREHTLPWDAQKAAESIEAPTLMIHSEKALAPALARSFFARLGSAKRELWVESEGQIDFYDRPERIEPAADALAAHFGEHL